MTITPIEYMGFKNCFKLNWLHFKIIVTQDVGIRILSMSYNDGKSIFAGKTNEHLNSDTNTWKLYSGHRLWVAPEDKMITYTPDNKPIQIEFVSDTMLVMRQSIEDNTGIKKTVSLQLRGTGKHSYVQVVHYVENKSVWPIQIAPWAISVLGSGTKAIIPLSNNEPSGLLPKTSISIWNYTKLQDPRLTLGNKYICVQQKDSGDAGSNKIGSRVNSGWSAAINEDTLFVKVIDQCTNGLSVDLGCNVEVYTDNEMLELETIGKLQQLLPTLPTAPLLDVGKVVSSCPEVAVLSEKWFLFQVLHTHKPPCSDDDIDKHILPIINEIKLSLNQ